MKKFLIFGLVTMLGASSVFASSPKKGKKEVHRKVAVAEGSACQREAYAAAYTQLISDMSTDLSENFSKLTLTSAGNASTQKGNTVTANVSIGIDVGNDLITSQQYKVILDSSHDNACVVKSVELIIESTR